MNTSKPQEYLRQLREEAKTRDYSATAIESRFSSGRWDAYDTRYIVSRLREMEQKKTRLTEREALVAEFSYKCAEQGDNIDMMSGEMMRTEKVGVSVYCTVCGLRKKPIGRSAPLEMANSLCDGDCPGYSQEPYIGQLWPGETREEFGF